MHCKYLSKPKKSFLRLCMGQREVLTVHEFSVLSCLLSGFLMGTLEKKKEKKKGKEKKNWLKIASSTF